MADNILKIDPETSPRMTEEELENVLTILDSLCKVYLENKDTMTAAECLKKGYSEQFPELSPEEVDSVIDEILSSLEKLDDCSESLEKAIASGRSREDWFCTEILKAFGGNYDEAGQCVEKLNTALEDLMADLLAQYTVKKSFGECDLDPDTFFPEYYHVFTFNKNAAQEGSKYHAEVVKPENGETESAKIVIKDEDEKVVKTYVSQYGETQDEKELKEVYNAVPGVQNAERTLTVITAPDGTHSTRPAKAGSASKYLHKKVDKSWNLYKYRSEAASCIKYCGQEALVEALKVAGKYTMSHIREHEKVHLTEMISLAIDAGAEALRSEAGMMIKALISTAIDAAKKNGMLKFLPKRLSGNILTSIVKTLWDNAVIISKLCEGKLTAEQALVEMEKTTVATLCGASIAKIASTMGTAGGAVIGAEIGSLAGTVFGPVGTALGMMLGKYLGNLISATIAGKIGNRASYVFQKVMRGLNAKAAEKIEKIIEKRKNSMQNELVPQLAKSFA